MKHVLQWAGRNGAVVVIAGVVIGLAVPDVSALARPYLAVAIFVFTFGSFLKLDTSAFGRDVVEAKRVALMVLWATFGVPLAVMVLIKATRPGPDLAQGLLFWALVPASPACVAFASILRLSITAALISSTRTITLAWVVVGNQLLPLADLFLATGMVAKYTAPGLTKWLVTSVLAVQPAHGPAVNR